MSRSDDRRDAPRKYLPSSYLLTVFSMKERIIHISLSSVLICISFFLGYTFSQKYTDQTVREAIDTHYRVDLSFSGKTLHIKKDTPAISVYLDGERIDREKQITLSK